MPKYKQNPSPQDQYDLTIVVDNAPGPFASVQGAMQYDISNRDCLPPAEGLSVAQTTPISSFIPIALKRVNETTFEGIIALDGLVDEDYFGHGVCHFRPIGPSFSLKATGASGETKFVASRWAEDFEFDPQGTTYYLRSSYPKHQKISDYPDVGAGSPEEYKESLRGDLFSVSITARKVQQ
ncbi:hypothetical protein [Lysobacter antibioticus]|nr:hypothetical protein [Lysobacter antibioticus]